MGSVVAFRPRGAAMRRNRLPAETAASIVIFPGVRYERNVLDAPPGNSSATLQRAADRHQDMPAPRR